MLVYTVSINSLMKFHSDLFFVVKDTFKVVDQAKLLFTRTRSKYTWKTPSLRL
jgi:hypothetical protein